MAWYEDEDRSDRREAVAREIAKRRQRGEPFIPVVCEVPRGLPCRTFWGQAWCRNLEQYSDYESRLPRGRSYLRGGQVYDLEIVEGAVEAYVTGSEIYEVRIGIDTLAADRWQAIKTATSGEITGLGELLEGRLGPKVLALITDPERGLFPSPDEIVLHCSCPDWADMCKHVAAVLYGVGVRLDHEPSLFFTLRGVNQNAIVGAAREAIERGAHLQTEHSSVGVLAADELSALFGIDLGQPGSAFATGHSGHKEADGGRNSPIGP